MKRPQELRRVLLYALAMFFCITLTWREASAADPLPSWNDGPAKQAILAFVAATTDQASPGFVPPEDRIATFDQDGTLWVSHPLYTQAMFARLPLAPCAGVAWFTTATQRRAFEKIDFGGLSGQSLVRTTYQTNTKSNRREEYSYDTIRTVGNRHVHRRVLATLPAQAQSVAGSKPNILLIVGDDVGYGDLGPYLGGKPGECRPPTSISSLKKE